MTNFERRLDALQKNIKERKNISRLRKTDKGGLANAKARAFANYVGELGGDNARRDFIKLLRDYRAGSIDYNECLERAKTLEDRYKANRTKEQIARNV